MMRAVVIGASAGGVQALSQVLPSLPVDFPLPVLVVVHIPPRRDNALVDLFAGKCRIPVKEAEDKVKVLLNHLLIFLKLRYLNSNRPCCGALFYFYWWYGLSQVLFIS